MCLDFQAYDFEGGNDLPYILNLPTYAACAWYHKKLPDDLQEMPLAKLLKEVEHFALHEYATALLLGDMLSSEEHQQIVHRLANYTGLKKDFIKASHLRILSNNFYHELLKQDSKIIGRFDGRYVAFDTTYIEEPHQVPDPSFEAITGPFTSAFQQYLYEQLKVDKTSPYYILNPNVFPWNFSVDRQAAGLGYIYMSGKLRSLIEKNPALNVLVLSGIYDLATPYFASNYTLNHLKLNPSLRKNVEIKTYEAGHMMYLNPKAHKDIKTDLVRYLDK
jgi:carboxypeptidase C (cathepsin A)